MTNLNIPELSGFKTPTTVDELQTAMAWLPKDVREKALREQSLIMMRESTREVAILQPCADGSWDVEVFGPAAGGGSRGRQRRHRPARRR